MALLGFFQATQQYQHFPVEFSRAYTDADLFGSTPKRNVGTFYKTNKWTLMNANSASTNNSVTHGIRAPPVKAAESSGGVRSRLPQPPAHRISGTNVVGQWKTTAKTKGKGKCKGKGKGKSGSGKGRVVKVKGKLRKKGSHKVVKVKRRKDSHDNQMRLPSRAPPKRAPSVDDVATLPAPPHAALDPLSLLNDSSSMVAPSEDASEDDLPLDQLGQAAGEDVPQEVLSDEEEEEGSGESELHEPKPRSMSRSAPDVRPVPQAAFSPPARPAAPRHGSAILARVNMYNSADAVLSEKDTPATATQTPAPIAATPPRATESNLERFLATPTNGFTEAQLLAASTGANLLALDLGSAGTPKKKKKKKESKKSKFRKGTKRVPAKRAVGKAASPMSPLLSELFTQVDAKSAESSPTPVRKRSSPQISPKHNKELTPIRGGNRTSLRVVKSSAANDPLRRRALSRSSSPTPSRGASPPKAEPSSLSSSSSGLGSLAAQRLALSQSPKAHRRRGSKNMSAAMTVRIKKKASGAGLNEIDPEEEEESESSSSEESDSPNVSEEEEVSTSMYGLDLESTSPSRFASPPSSRVERQRASHEKNFRKKMFRNQAITANIERAAVIALAERRKMLHQYAFCGEQLESHTLFHRKWIEGSMIAPEMKEKRRLIAAKDGLYNLEMGKRSVCTVPDYPVKDMSLEDPEFYKRHFNDFVMPGPHVYYLCVDGKEWKEYGSLARKKRPSNPKKDAARLQQLKDMKMQLIEKSSLIAVRAAPEAHYLLIFKRFSLGRLAMPYGQTSIKQFLSGRANFVGKEVLTVQPGFNSALDPHVSKWELYGSRLYMKVGVLYAMNGQNVEEDVYSNQQDSIEFKHFLMMLGNVVTLNGFSGYRGGLNVKENSTGIFSVYNKVTFTHDGRYSYDITKQQAKQPKLVRNLQDVIFAYEMMFHVSTFLPFTPENPQQLAKKRHIGNDIVVIIFKDSSEEDSIPFQPEILTSAFHRIFIVVSPWIFNEAGQLTHYKVAVASKQGVRPFRPYVPKNGIISKRNLTTWLLLKCINGERAALYENEFARKEQRTNISQMRVVYDIIDQQLQSAIQNK